MLRIHARISILILTTLIIATCLATLTPLHAKYVTNSIREEAYTDWYTVNNTYANDVATGDLDNDGTVEIVEGITYHTGKPWPPVPSYDYRYGQIRIFNHNGTTLQLEYTSNWTIAETAYRDFYALCIEDIDNDGTKEIITGSCIWEQIGAGEYEGELAVWNWTGTTLNQEKYTKWYAPHQDLVYDVWAGDVDGDNQTDIVTTGTYYNETSTYVCSELKIWNATGIVYPNPKPECTQQWWTNELVYSRSVTAADVDNDTQTEIITAGYRRTQTNYYISQLKIWSWNGTTLTLEKTEEWGSFTAGDSCTIYEVYAADLADDNNLTEIVTVGYRNLTAAIAQVRIWN
jgi:virulence-associated protein VapD